MENHSQTLLLASSLAGLYILVQIVQYAVKSYHRRIFKRQKGCRPEPRYPNKDPIFGADIFLENLKHSLKGGFLQKVQDRYDVIASQGKGKHTYSLVLTGERILQTRDPENIKAILATQFKEFRLSHMRRVAFGEMFGHGIFTTDGKEWEDSRALLRPSFNRSQVGDIETFEMHVSKLIDRIPKDGSTFDIQALFFMLTMDSATEFLFGHSTCSLDEGTTHERGKRFSEAFTDATMTCGNIGRLNRLGFLAKTKKYRDDVAFVHEYVQDYVQKAVSLHEKGGKEKVDSAKSKYVFLEELAKTGYGERKLQDELLNILLAGRDTTASLLSYLFYNLARDPEVFKKLRSEVLALGDDLPTFEQLKECRYLQWALNETLRLLPIVPVNSRMAVVDTTIPRGGGPDGNSPVFVPAGGVVSYQVHAMHHRKDIYGEDADEFKPERWANLRPGWAYLPFNGGPRICLGQQFALTEASYTVIRLLQAFKDVENRDPTEFKEHLTITTSVKGGVLIALTPA